MNESGFNAHSNPVGSNFGPVNNIYSNYAINDGLGPSYAATSANIEDDSTVIRRHRHRLVAGEQLICAICGDEACGYNFDAPTCHSCKLFFRRNAFRTLSCPFGQACHIDKVRRKFCAACRLAKCFEMKMKKEFIKIPPVLGNKDMKLKRKWSRSISVSKKEDSNDASAQKSPQSDSSEDSTPTSRLKYSDCSSEKVTAQNNHGFDLSRSIKNEYDFQPFEANNYAHKPIANAVMAPVQDLQSNYAVAMQTCLPQQVTAHPAQLGNRYTEGGLAGLESKPEMAKPKVVNRLFLTEFEYDKMLLACSNGWKMAVQPVGVNEYQETVSKSRLNASLSLLNSSGQSLFQYINFIELGVRRSVAAFKQVPEFKNMPRDLQMHLLKSAALSVLNVSAVFVFDAAEQQWVIRITNGDEQRIAVREIIELLNKLDYAEISEYMLQYTRFHTDLRQMFADDNVVLFVMVLLDLFSPSRFESIDVKTAQILRPTYEKYALFLKRYIKRHYKPAMLAAGSAISVQSHRDNSQHIMSNLDNDSSCDSDDSAAASANDDADCETDDARRPLQRRPPSFDTAGIVDGRHSRSSLDVNNDSRTLVNFVFDRLNDHAKALEAHLMRLSSRLLVNGSALSPLLREILQVAESAFVHQLDSSEASTSNSAVRH